VCVTVMCWCSTFWYSVASCVCYCNVLLQYSWLQGYCCVCVTVICWCSTVGKVLHRVCVTLMCLCSRFRYIITVVFLLL